LIWASWQRPPFGRLSKPPEAADASNGGGLANLKDLILGLDPGSRHTGYGLIEVDADRLAHVTHGIIHLNEKWPMFERLRVLHLELGEIFQRFTIKSAAIEKIFFGKNADSAFKLGHARGVCLLAAALNHATVAEYAARFVKKSVTGSGAADKSQVQLMICTLLRIPSKEIGFDATDALSLAVTHARMREVETRMRKANRRLLEGEGSL
jgi:crossover junction endodeoxyribonuclease RuvC